MRLFAADGFTLVELLASLAVLALLSLVLLQGLTSRSLAWGRIDRDTERGEAVEAAQIALADRVRRIWPQTSYNFNPPGPDFDGETEEMQFLATPQEAKGIGPLRHYRLSLEPGGDVVLESRSDLALDQRHWADRQVLIRGVQVLELTYYGKSNFGSRPGWRADWTQESFLPALIRVRLTFPEGDRRRWPDLMVRPAADLDTDCRWMVDTGRCSAR